MICVVVSCGARNHIVRSIGEDMEEEHHDWAIVNRFAIKFHRFYSIWFYGSEFEPSVARHGNPSDYLLPGLIGLAAPC